MVTVLSSLCAFMFGAFLAIAFFAFDKSLIRLAEGQVVIEERVLVSFKAFMKEHKRRSRYDYPLASFEEEDE